MPGTYFNCIMFMVASSVVTTIMILNYHHRQADTHEMPSWVSVKMLLTPEEKMEIFIFKESIVFTIISKWSLVSFYNREPNNATVYLIGIIKLFLQILHLLFSASMKTIELDCNLRQGFLRPNNTAFQ